MHHHTAFYNEEHFNRLLSDGPRYINVFILEGFREPDRHIFGSASLKPQLKELFRKVKPSYRLVVKRKNFQ